METCLITSEMMDCHPVCIIQQGQHSLLLIFSFSVFLKVNIIIIKQAWKPWNPPLGLGWEAVTLLGSGSILVHGDFREGKILARYLAILKCTLDEWNGYKDSDSGWHEPHLARPGSGVNGCFIPSYANGERQKVHHVHSSFHFLFFLKNKLLKINRKGRAV